MVLLSLLHANGVTKAKLKSHSLSYANIGEEGGPIPLARNAKLRECSSTSCGQVPNDGTDPQKCPICSGQLLLSKSKVLSYRLVPDVQRPVKRQQLEVIATSKWCRCGYWSKEIDEKKLEEVEV